jgi:hypothetical protein
MDSTFSDLAIFLKRIHDLIAVTVNMNDKALHFIVLGIAGMLILAISFPMFKFFDIRNNALGMTLVYSGVVLSVFIIATGLVQGITPTAMVVLSLIGIIVFLVSHRIFLYLDVRDKALRITNFFTLTLVVIFAVAIEVCQGLTETGSMEIADVLFGIAGYVSMYLALLVIITLIKAIFKKRK